MKGIAMARFAVFVAATLTGLRGGVTQQQVFREMPASVQVSEGDNVTLRCAVDHQHGKAQWTKDGFALGFERSVPGYPRYRYFGDSAKGEHHLVVSGVTLTEDGEYQCQVGPTATSPAIWAAANLTVMLAPESVEIAGWGEGAVVEVTEGTTLPLECLVSEARPAARTRWSASGTTLDHGGSDVSIPSAGRRWRVSSKLNLTAAASDDGGDVTCTVDHPALQHALAVTIKFSVLHPPGPPVISGYKNGDVIRAGSRLRLECRVKGGNPRAWVLWYRRGDLVDDTSVAEGRHVTNIHELAVTQREDGATYSCAVSSDVMPQQATANVTLTVYYPPSSVRVSGGTEVGADDPINLTCETSNSNPPASLTWTIQGEVVEASRSVVARDSGGGWVTASELTGYRVRSTNATQVTVECRAVNPTIDEVVRASTVVTITRPPKLPSFHRDPEEEIVSGTVVDLTCLTHGGHPPPSIRIFHGDSALATEMSRDGDVTRGRAEIEVTPSDHGSRVMCEATNPATTAPLTATSTLHVLYGPWEVQGGADPSTVDEGAEVSLHCVTSPARPPAALTWASSGAPLPNANTSSLDGPFGGTKTRSVVVVVAGAEDDGRVFTCTADNGIAEAVSTDVKLSVLHTPVWVVSPPPVLAVYEGAAFTVTASASANPRPVRYMWRRGEVTVQQDGGGELQLATVSRRHGGNYTVTATNPRGSTNASFLLNVQYGPEDIRAPEVVTVGEGGAATLECTAGGNPPPTLTWTRHAHVHNSTARSLGTGVGVARLVVEVATWADTGLYLCHASNLVSATPPITTKLIVTQPARTATDSGGGGAWAAVGGSARLVCRVRAAPAPTFTWTTANGNTIATSEKYNVHDPQLVDGLVVWASVLEIRQVDREDYGPFVCAAHNQLGADTARLTLSPPARPHPPTDLVVSNVTSSSVSLVWTPNFDAGLPRGYTVSCSDTHSTEHQVVELSGGHTAGTTLTGLYPETTYDLTLQAFNDQGRSSTLTTTATTPAVASGVVLPARSRVPRLIMFIMTLTGATLLTLNVVIIACFVRRRTASTPPPASASGKGGVGVASSATSSKELLSTPASSHPEVLLSLNTMTSPSTCASTPASRRQAECHVEEDTPLHNGVLTGLGSRKSSVSSRHGVLRSNHSAASLASVASTHSGSVVHTSDAPACPPTPPTPTTVPPSPQPYVPPHSADVCSLSSGTYDPHQSATPQQCQRRNSGTSSFPGDDQLSLASHQSQHSTHSRTYSQGYVRPHAPPPCQQPPRYTPHQPYQPHQQLVPAPAGYTSLDTSSLYTISADYFPSIFTGGPQSYATLGPRARRASTSQFATLQRPRPTRSFSQSSPGPPCPPECGSQCCPPSADCGDGCPGHVRSSSFHAPVRTDSLRQYHMGSPGHSQIRPPPPPSTPVVYMRPTPPAPVMDATQRPAPPYDPACTAPTSTPINTPPPPWAPTTFLPPPPPVPALTAAGAVPSTSAGPSVNPNTTGTLSGRPRFPHDYVRQGSVKTKPAKARDANNTATSNKGSGDESTTR